MKCFSAYIMWSFAMSYIVFSWHSHYKNFVRSDGVHSAYNHFYLTIGFWLNLNCHGKERLGKQMKKEIK